MEEALGPELVAVGGVGRPRAGKGQPLSGRDARQRPDDGHGAFLRFSHDGSLIPLAYLMGLKETQGGRSKLDDLYKYLSIDKISPMAANIQLIFYRKEGSDDVLVKFLLNANETSIPIATDRAPYYHWKDVKEYWAQRK